MNTRYPKKKFPFGLLLLLASFLLCSKGNGAPLSPQCDTAPVKIIFDTDMGNDVDDALALALIHSLQNKKSCELLAVTLTNPDPMAAVYVDAINMFYGRPGIPTGNTPDSPKIWNSKYLRVAEKKDPQGTLLYPSHYTQKNSWDSVKLLRKILAESKDNEIVIIQVGFSTNLARLLDTKADEYSPLVGIDLVQRKVKLLSIMAGMFPEDTSRKPEFNVRHDISSADKLIKLWPTPIVWNGMELGEKVCFPAECMDRGFNYVKHHPIYDSYQLYRPTPHERPLWDPISVLYAVWPHLDDFSLSSPGTVTLSKDGRTRFIEGKGSRDRYLKANPSQAKSLRRLLAQLISEAPQRFP